MGTLRGLLKKWCRSGKTRFYNSQKK